MLSGDIAFSFLKSPSSTVDEHYIINVYKHITPVSVYRHLLSQRDTTTDGEHCGLVTKVDVWQEAGGELVL